MTALLVDPHEEFRAAATALLARDDIAVTGAAGFDEAAPAGGDVDCVAVDPRGRDDVARAEWAGLGAPVVVVTGARIGDVPADVRSAAAAYVEKGRSSTFRRFAATVRGVVRADRFPPDREP